MSDFCTELTKITQDKVDNGISLQEALANLDTFLKESELINSNFTFVTCGNFDMNALEAEAEFKKLKYPDYLRSFINIKENFPKDLCKFKNKKEAKRLPDMVTMLRFLDLELIGTHHSGIDDARNISRICQKLI